MRAAKFLILFLGICLAIGFCGEINQYDVYNFTTKYSNVYTAYEELPPYREFVKRLMAAGEEHEVGLIAKAECYQKDGSIRLSVYCNEQMRQRLRKEGLDFEGEYRSLVYETRVVTLEDFSEILQLEKNLPTTFSFAGDRDDIMSVYEKAYERGNVSYLNSGYDSSERDVLMLVWAMVLAVFFLLLLFDVLASRRENFVLISLGVSRTLLILKHALLDCLGCVVLFFAARWLLSKVYFVNNMDIHYIALAILCVGCLLAHALCARVNIKKAYKQVQISAGIVGIFDGIKIFVAVISTVMLVVLFLKLDDTARRKDFLAMLEQKESCTFLTVEANGFGEYEDFTEQLAPVIDDYYAQLKPMYVLGSAHSVYDYNDEYKIILISYHARELVKGIGDFKGSSNREYTVYAPKQLPLSDEELLCNEELYEALYVEVPADALEIVRYRPRGSVPYFSGGEGMLNISYDELPIVIVHNQPESGEAVADVIREWGDRKINIMVDGNSEVIKAFTEEVAAYDYAVLTLRARAGVSQMLRREKSQTAILLLTAALFIIYDLMLALYLSRLEFVVYKRQMAIKRIVGCSLFERYRRTFFRTIGVYGVAMAAVVVTGFFLKGISVLLLLQSIGVFMCLELALCLLRMWKLERMNLRSSLNGGVYG